jgi:hypothetical protein
LFAIIKKIPALSALMALPYSPLKSLEKILPLALPSILSAEKIAISLPFPTTGSSVFFV